MFTCTWVVQIQLEWGNKLGFDSVINALIDCLKSRYRWRSRFFYQQQTPLHSTTTTHQPDTIIPVYSLRTKSNIETHGIPNLKLAVSSPLNPSGHLQSSKWFCVCVLSTFVSTWKQKPQNTGQRSELRVKKKTNKQKTTEVWNADRHFKRLSPRNENVLIALVIVQWLEI